MGGVRLFTFFPKLAKFSEFSTVEVSLDLHGVPMGEVHPLPQQTTTVKTYGNGGKLQTIYLGKKMGNQYRIYDRAEKRGAYARDQL